MSDIIKTPDENAENQNHENINWLTNQQEKTDKDLLKVLNFIKDMSHEDIDEEEIDKINEIEDGSDFINYNWLEDGNELVRLKQYNEWNKLYHMWKISKKDIEAFFDFEFNPAEDDSETIKFWIISDTKENHSISEIKENWTEIMRRREKIMIIWSTFKRLSFDILNDWERIERLWLTDDKITTWRLMDLDMIDGLTYGIHNINDLENASQFTHDDVIKVKNAMNVLSLGLIHLENLLEIKEATPEDIQKVEERAEYLWVKGTAALESNSQGFNVLKNISEETLEYCFENWIKNIRQISFVEEINKLRDKEKIKEYILRKNEYLSKNRTIPEEKFVEYFWKKWKYWKQEIQQWKLWLCYMYSVLETLKRLNWFDELIQTNLIQNNEWWIVRIPFQNWKWIQVWKDEIDEEYKIEENKDKSPEANLLRTLFGSTYRTVKINSDTESLWIKILEIAYIKNMLIAWKNLSDKWGYVIKKEKLINKNIKEWKWTIDEPLNLKVINGEMLEKIEWWFSMQSLRDMLWEGNIDFWVYDVMQDVDGKERLERLKEYKAPQILIDRLSFLNINSTFKDISFEAFRSWFLSIHMGVDKRAANKFNRWVTKNKMFISTNDVKILDKHWKEVSWEKLKNKKDVYINADWKVSVGFIKNHAYSVEKCYTNGNWEKRIRIVNPWHTDIKFDIPLNRCKDNFEREVWIIKIDNLFR